MNVSAVPPYSIGDKCNITVGLANVNLMTGYGITFAWNSTYMNATGNYWLDSFFIGEMIGGRWSAASIEYVTNDLRVQVGNPLLPPLIGMFTGYGQTALGAQYNLNGTYDIVKIEFRINAFGPHGYYIWKDPTNYNPWPYNACQPYLSKEGAFPTAFHETYSGWKNTTGHKPDYDVVWCAHPLFAPPAPISGSVANAVLWIQPPSPYPPVATKTHSPTFPFVDDTVTFTITQTLAGFDGAATHDIDQVTIDYGIWGASNTSAFTPPSMNFYYAYNVSGTYTVSVSCYASGMPPGLQWCNFSQTIEVFTQALTGIDVYQVRHVMWPGDPAGTSGEGPGVPSRPYDPQTLVVLEAYVFYNGEPVQCKIVSFEVTIPALEMCILYRTDQANATGYASIEFRIAEMCWEYGGPEAIFGKWLVYVSVEMCEEKFNDTMWFDVGWILTLSDMISVDDCVDPEPLETFKKCEVVSFLVTVSNIDWLWVPALMILVVYDDNEVPIGQELLGIEVPPGAFCDPAVIEVCIGLHIPKYAYVGTERPIGYINLFTAIPSECGLPYCPEVSDPIVIIPTE